LLGQIAAHLGRIDGETRCAVWADDPTGHGFDPRRLIEIDLAATPSAAAAKEIDWNDVQVDDCVSGPNGVVVGTTLGPRWPEIGLIGWVYLERRYAESLPAELRPACPPSGADGRPYEYTTAVYHPSADDPRSGKRYAGHHAEILRERFSLAQVAVYPPGRSRSATVRPVTMWIDLESPDQCDAGPAALTTIGVGKAPKSGALFLPSGELPG
jgi:hypothetical protein